MARRPRDPVVLTDGERDTLVSWTRSRTRSQAQVLRARIVLACAQEATNTAVANRLGVSVDMVRTWRFRFAAERLDGLTERSRPGRPPAVDDDTIAQVLVRTLDPPPDGRRWSTRAMANAVGLSQTKVSRIWRAHRIHPKPGHPPPREETGRTRLPGQVRDLAGLFLAPPLRVLAVAADDHSVGRTDRPPPSSRTSAQARELFAVANAFATVTGATNTHDTPAGHTSSLLAFLQHLDRTVPASMTVHLLVDGLNAAAQDTVATWQAAQPRFHQHAITSPDTWLDHIDILLAHNPLPRDNVLGAAASLAGLRDELRTWCTSWTPPSPAFSWTKSPRALWSDDRDYQSLINDSNAANDAQPTGTGKHEPRNDAPGAPRIADRVAQLVREALATGQFKPGERVKETPLATRLGVSRPPVREALRVLAEEGMLELLPTRGTAVPDITATNILDLYAVRASLGALLMRRIATLPRAALRPVSTALAEVRVVARHADHARIGEVDLQFQDAIARTAQLPQAGRIFDRLTMRLRMFNAILQLDWAEAVDLIAREDIGIYDAIRNGDGNEAARRWRVKVERSVRYMVAQLPQDHFDPNLWITIAGKPNPRRGDPSNIQSTPSSPHSASR